MTLPSDGEEQAKKCKGQASLACGVSKTNQHGASFVAHPEMTLQHNCLCCKGYFKEESMNYFLQLQDAHSSGTMHGIVRTAVFNPCAVAATMIVSSPR